MKLATLKNTNRDGQLVVVNRALTQYQAVPEIAPTMQHALDNWNSIESQLEVVYQALEKGISTSAQKFIADACHAPLPRAYQWVDGSAYVNHVELVRRARNAKMPESFWHDPLVYQGGSDSFIGPCDDVPLVSEQWGIDFEAEVGVIINDVSMGASLDVCTDAICLFVLINDVSLRALIPDELAKGFGFFQSKPSSTFSPVAVTPDELGDAWRNGRLHLPLHVNYNQKPFGRANAGEDMTFNFPQLIAHATKTRPLGAGTIIGSGTVSNKQNGDHGQPISAGGVGYSCIAELRMIETINAGKPSTPFMKFGDRVSIEMHNEDGQSIFGAINQTIVRRSH